MSELPPVPKDLLDALKERFPLKPPDLRDSERGIWIEAGRQYLIEFLEFQYQKQQDNIMKNDHVLS